MLYRATNSAHLYHLHLYFKVAGPNTNLRKLAQKCALCSALLADERAFKDPV